MEDIAAIVPVFEFTTLWFRADVPLRFVRFV